MYVRMHVFISVGGPDLQQMRDYLSPKKGPYPCQCGCECLYINVYAHVCMHMCVCICSKVCIYTSVHAYARVCMQVCPTCKYVASTHTRCMS